MIEVKPRILSLFHNEFNKFNNTRARMLDSIYHMPLRLLSGVKTLYFFLYVRHVVMDVITFPEICKPRVYRIDCMAFHSQLRRYIIIVFIVYNF